MDIKENGNVIDNKIINPAEYLKKCIECMEKGDYVNSIKYVTISIESLVKDNTQILKKDNIMMCVKYKLIVSILAQIKELENNNGN
jgi:hypothetical protein